MRDALSTNMRRDLPEWRRRFKLRDKDVEMLRSTLRKFRIKHLPLTDAESHTWNRVQELIGRFQRANRIVLGLPMWNFSIPYTVVRSPSALH
jgi:FMN-dependent NADH-azoreductase